MNQAVAVINQSTVVSDVQVKQVVEALNIQSDHYEQVWGHGATYSFRDKTAPSQAGVWELIVLDDSDQAGALGYHDLTQQGDPIGFVFAKTSIDAGESWTVCASHEAWEMAEDPYINTTAENDTGSTARFYAFEVCDACEDDQFAYSVTLQDGTPVLVSDFVTPKWFNAAETTGPFDYKEHISSPLQLLEGGYIGYIDAQSKSGWQQLQQAMTVGHLVKAKITEGHRRYRRLTRKHWQKSKNKTR